MGAHGTLDQALAGVASFAGASPEEEARLLRRERKKAKKHKSSGKDTEADGHKRSRGKDKALKDKAKHHKGKDKRERRKHEASSDDDAASSSGDDAGSLQEQLARGRAAARLVRRMLSERPELKTDLREVSCPDWLYNWCCLC